MSLTWCCLATCRQCIVGRVFAVLVTKILELMCCQAMLPCHSPPCHVFITFFDSKLAWSHTHSGACLHDAESWAFCNLYNCHTMSAIKHGTSHNRSLAWGTGNPQWCWKISTELVLITINCDYVTAPKVILVFQEEKIAVEMRKKIWCSMMLFLN